MSLQSFQFLKKAIPLPYHHILLPKGNCSQLFKFNLFIFIFKSFNNIIMYLFDRIGTDWMT